MRKFSYVLIIGILLLVAFGCSKGNVPTAPEAESYDNINADLPLFVTSYDSEGMPSGGDAALGVFSVRVDTKTLEYEMTPLRNSAEGSKDVLEVLSITNFVTGWPCKDCASLLEVGMLDENRLNLLFGIKHPFPTPKPGEPGSAKNRADLHVFNVEGMLVLDDTAQNFPNIGIKVNQTFKVTNAEGYSGYLDDSLDEIMFTEADIHPYRTYFVNYGEGNYSPSNQYGFASLANPSGYMVMKQGSLMDKRNYFVTFTPGAILDFLFVVQVSWGQSTKNYTQRLQAQYDCPQFNKKAASVVEVEVVGKLTAGDTFSSVDVNIGVLDINYGVAVGTQLGKMLDNSDVDGIRVEVPGVTAGLPFSSPSPTGGDPRDPDNPLMFELKVYNQRGAGAGKYNGLVEIVDTYATGQNPNPVMGGKDGAKRVPIGLSPLTGLFA
ncbi:hypothetical protein KKB99_06665, partial [bacterium]|nr:hypothetical protein [bacterium]MBU1025672.1 hypothetical protein [bacterium]